MALVLDANVVVAACMAASDGFLVFGSQDLIAPDLMWWEVASTLHEYVWRIKAGRRTPDMLTLERHDVLTAFRRLQQGPVRAIPTTSDLMAETWRVADRCGFARVYDAAYVAVARLQDAPLVTLDRRLRNSPAAKLATIVGPTEVT